MKPVTEIPDPPSHGLYVRAVDEIAVYSHDETRLINLAVDINAACGQTIEQMQARIYAARETPLDLKQRNTFKRNLDAGKVVQLDGLYIVFPWKVDLEQV